MSHAKRALGRLLVTYWYCWACEPGNRVPIPCDEEAPAAFTEDWHPICKNCAERMLS